MNKLTIAIGSDHAGFQLKEELRNYLSDKGYLCIDFGCYSTERADYPDFAHLVSKAVEEKEFTVGVLLCGSGNGINMTANKHAGIRSALCWNAEIALLARQHNDANIIALPARFISADEAKKSIDVFLTTPFEGGRHQDRIRKIDLAC